MEKSISLFLLVTFEFIIYQNASALMKNAIPQKQEFSPNWLLKGNANGLLNQTDDNTFFIPIHLMSIGIMKN